MEGFLTSVAGTSSAKRRSERSGDCWLDATAERFGPEDIRRIDDVQEQFKEARIRYQMLFGADDLGHDFLAQIARCVTADVWPEQV